MKRILSSAKDFIIDIFFPKFCVNCNREGDYLCQDCFSLIDVFNRQYCPFCWPPKVVLSGRTCKYCRRSKKLTGLFCAASYNNFIVKKLINQFKYEPYIRDLSGLLAFLILSHFAKLENPDFFREQAKNFIIIPIPLHKKKLKERGFNQAEEIAQKISDSLNIPIFKNVLIKIKQTPAQVDLDKDKRKSNLINAFKIKNPELITGKKILLIDDVFTTGATLEEGSRLLKLNGAREVWGVVVARG